MIGGSHERLTVMLCGVSVQTLVCQPLWIDHHFFNQGEDRHVERNEDHLILGQFLRIALRSIFNIITMIPPIPAIFRCRQEKLWTELAKLCKGRQQRIGNLHLCCFLVHWMGGGRKKLHLSTWWQHSSYNILRQQAAQHECLDNIDQRFGLFFASFWRYWWEAPFQLAAVLRRSKWGQHAGNVPIMPGQTKLATV